MGYQFARVLEFSVANALADGGHEGGIAPSAVAKVLDELERLTAGPESGWSAAGGASAKTDPDAVARMTATQGRGSWTLVSLREDGISRWRQYVMVTDLGAESSSHAVARSSTLLAAAVEAAALPSDQVPKIEEKPTQVGMGERVGLPRPIGGSVFRRATAPGRPGWTGTSYPDPTRPAGPPSR